MIRTSYLPLVVFSLVAVSPLARIDAQTGVQSAADPYDQTRYSANQLDNLVGPIALYPDALLAQVLIAATFPDQVDDAARWVRQNGTNGIDDQSWDVSVRAVAHYPSALNMMADKIDWTATLGRAYANQSSDVMAAVQRMRVMADQQGNLVSTQQQQVIREGPNYVIVPAQPRVIYVPVYDPVYIYTRPVFSVGVSGRYWSFGIGFPIGGWLMYDLDWRVRSVYYNGWNDSYFAYGGGWRARSRPFVQITNVYVNPRYRNVYVNRDVVHRTVDYRNVDRYSGVHRDAYFDNRRDGNRDVRDNRDNRGDRDARDPRDRAWPYGSGVGRSAPPRDDRPQATPDGYRNGPDRGAQPGSRSSQAAPESRRREPVMRGNDMSVSPEAVRGPQRDGGQRGGGQRGSGQPDRGQPDRGQREPQAQPRMPNIERSAPPARVDAPRGEAPKQQSRPEQGREKQGDSGERRAQPRGGRPPEDGSRGRDRPR